MNASGSIIRYWPLAAVIALGNLTPFGRAEGEGTWAQTAGSNILWMESTGSRAGLVSLTLHGTRPGEDYQILASQGLVSPAWIPVEAISGAPDANQTPTAVALAGGVRMAFFQARVQGPQDRLWLEIPTNALAVAQQMTVVLHNTIPGVQYDVLTKAALTDPVWTTEGIVYGAAGGVTPITLSRKGRPTLFTRVRSGDDTSASAYWTTDSTDLTADRVTALYSGGIGGPLTADTTRVSADIRK
jgi:hypothetical protein